MIKIILIMVVIWPTIGYAQSDMITIHCGRTKVMLSVHSQEAQALSVMSQNQVCDCSRRKWRGLDCDVRYLRAVAEAEMDRKNQIIADEILRGLE